MDRREGGWPVPSDPDTLRGPRVLSKNRMEGFSDGVFGFAMTLLVVDLALHPPGTPLQQLLHAWPAYLAYLSSSHGSINSSCASTCLSCSRWSSSRSRPGSSRRP